MATKLGGGLSGRSTKKNNFFAASLNDFTLRTGLSIPANARLRFAKICDPYKFKKKSLCFNIMSERAHAEKTACKSGFRDHYILSYNHLLKVKRNLFEIFFNNHHEKSFKFRKGN